jgi:hypothetical protein
MKNILFQQKMIQQEINSTMWKIKQIMQNVLKMDQISLLPKCKK